MERLHELQACEIEISREHDMLKMEMKMYKTNRELFEQHLTKNICKNITESEYLYYYQILEYISRELD
jgi:hypothetical protein